MTSTAIAEPAAPRDRRLPAPAPRAALGRWVGTLLALLVFGACYFSPVRAVTDSRWAVYTAHSLVTRGDANLDEFRGVVGANGGFQVERIHGHRYYAVPIGTSFSAVPFVAVFAAVDGRGVEAALRRGGNQPVDAFAAATLVALTALVVYAVALRATRRLWISFAVGLTFAFGTQAWSIASRTLWMHTPSMLCLSLALWCGQRLPSSRRAAVALGAILASAYFIRPTNAVACMCFGLWACVLGLPVARRVVAGAVPVVIAFMIANRLLFGMWLQPYFRANRLAVSGVTVEALVGNLVSPSRGVFVFVPIAALSIYGVVLKRRRRGLTGLDLAVAATICGTWIAVSCFPHWWAGASYGPRFMTDVAPYVAWFLIPVFESAFPPRGTRLATQPPLSRLAIVLCCLVAWSVFVQARGAFDEDTVYWNVTPRHVDADPSRVWDWADPQFLR